jgi:hypothetical protein
MNVLGPQRHHFRVPAGLYRLPPLKTQIDLISRVLGSHHPKTLPLVIPPFRDDRPIKFKLVDALPGSIKVPSDLRSTLGSAFTGVFAQWGTHCWPLRRRNRRCDGFNNGF